MLGKIFNDMENKKAQPELEGLSSEELIKTRTGYGNVDEVRKQILDEAEAK